MQAWPEYSLKTQTAQFCGLRTCDAKIQQTVSFCLDDILIFVFGLTQYPWLPSYTFFAPLVFGYIAWRCFTWHGHNHWWGDPGFTSLVPKTMFNPTQFSWGITIRGITNLSLSITEPNGKHPVQSFMSADTKITRKALMKDIWGRRNRTRDLSVTSRPCQRHLFSSHILLLDHFGIANADSFVVHVNLFFRYASIFLLRPE